MKKTLIILTSLAVMASFSMVVSAETVTDPTGDVFHWWQTGGALTWEYDANKPDVDIVEYSYEISDNTLTLSLSVDGVINAGELYSYSIIFASDTTGSTYTVTCTGGAATTYYVSQSGGGIGEASISGGTLSGTFDTTSADFSGYDIIVYAYQYTVLNDVTAEYWVDSNELIEDDGSTGDENTDTNDTGSDDTGTEDTTEEETGDSTETEGSGSENTDSGTPGFELIALIGAFAVLFVVIKKRR